MQFDNKTTRSVADAVSRILSGQTVSEALKGSQHKIDANKNNKIDAHDFELLRKKKKVEEETELTESHFKVGDEVVCKDSGMEGEVVEVDPKEEGKYYTVKREDGKMIKYAPDELKMEDEDDDEEDEDKKEMKEATKAQETKFHTKLDNMVHKTFGKRKEEMKESEQLDEYDAKQGVYKHKGTYGSAKGAEYGATDYKKENELAKAADKEKKKKPARKAYGARQNFVRAYAKESFSGMMGVYKEGGLKSLHEALVKEEPTNAEFTAELQNAKDKADLKKKQPDLAKPSVQAVKVEENLQDIHVINVDIANGVEIEDIQERSLTEPEMKKKEEIVMGMKKNLAGFKDRYGDRAKNVIYATATRMSKDEA